MFWWRNIVSKRCHIVSNQGNTALNCEQAVQHNIKLTAINERFSAQLIWSKSKLITFAHIQNWITILSFPEELTLKSSYKSLTTGIIKYYYFEIFFVKFFIFLKKLSFICQMLICFLKHSNTQLIYNNIGHKSKYSLSYYVAPCHNSFLLC